MDLTIQVYHHFVAGSADPRLDTILAHLGVLMATLKDVQDRLTTQNGDISRLTDVVGSVKALIEGDSAIIADLRKQLADAIAAGSDPAALQAVVDSMDAAHSAIQANIDAAAAAVVAGTPAA